ncbi:MAG: ABC transporter substrate-binding protein, partial [Chloroflexota bacterium]
MKSLSRFRPHPFQFLGLGLVLALLLAVACGAAATATPAPPAAKAAAPTPTLPFRVAATPSPVPPVVATKPAVDRLKVAMTPPAVQSTIGWLGARSSMGQVSAMYEGLVYENNTTGNFDPMMATQWELSKDAMTLRWKLRKGIPFHTGKEFTAKDVVFTYERVTGQDSVHSNVGRWKELIKSKDLFEIVNDYEIVLHCSTPCFEAPFFSSESKGGHIYSKDQWDATGGTTKGYADNPTGTGPFRFREFKEGQHIRFKRLEKHWRVVPDFKELQIFYVPEASTRLAQLLAGEVHISEIDRSLKAEVLKRGLKVESSTLPGISAAIFFGGNHISEKDVKGPLSNKLVRQALNLAFDRKAIQETIFGGDGELQQTPMVHSTDEVFISTWKLYPYDPVKAKELLAQAGYPNGFSMDLWTAVYPGAPELPQVAEAAATMWAKIGVKTKIIDSEFGKIRDRYRSRTFTGTEAFTFRGGLNPAFQQLQSHLASPAVAGGPLHTFEDPFLDANFRKFLDSNDVAERTRLQREMTDFSYKNYANVPLLWLGGLAGINPKVVV